MPAEAPRPSPARRESRVRAASSAGWGPVIVSGTAVTVARPALVPHSRMTAAGSAWSPAGAVADPVRPVSPGRKRALGTLGEMAATATSGSLREHVDALTAQVREQDLIVDTNRRTLAVLEEDIVSAGRTPRGRGGRGREKAKACAPQGTRGRPSPENGQVPGRPAAEEAPRRCARSDSVGWCPGPTRTSGERTPRTRRRGCGRQSTTWTGHCRPA